MSFRSLLATLLSPDNPVTLVANWFMDKSDRQYIDDQIRTLQGYVAGSLIRGQQSSYAIVHSSSGAVSVGDVLCSGPSTATEDDPSTALRYLTLAVVGGSMTASGVVAGIALTAAPPGGLVHYAYDGILGPTVTGLGISVLAEGPVRLDPSSSRCQRAALTSGSFPIGFLDGSGNLTFARGLPIP